MLDLFTAPYGHVHYPQPIAWHPRTVTKEEWPPNYAGVYAWRMEQLAKLRNDPDLLAHIKVYYKNNKKQFVLDWMDTYNPRLKGSKWVPFIFFPKQDEFWDFLEGLDRDDASGLVEKCRDIGATWECCAYSVCCWLFDDDDATGWGSRKQDLVDKLGDPDSIFEKMRLLLRRLPDVWLPDGFKTREHATFMKLINPETGSTITGESGDSIGRGGRKKRYFKDESAHYERPDRIESAVGDNTNEQIDISSVNGFGNVFHRKREAGIDWKRGLIIPAGYTRVFVFDWRDHPTKDQVWYDTRRAKALREGLLHIFAQEVDRDYSAAIENRIIDYAWITASVDAHKRLNWPDQGNAWMAGFDVADGGTDTNALAVRQGCILRGIDEWGASDTASSTDRVIAALRQLKGITIQYDSIGVGSGVKGEYNRLVRDQIILPRDYKFVPWNAGAKVVRPFERIIKDDDDSLLNRDFFDNFKAQAWWALRTRFYKTWRSVVFGDIYKIEELISLDSVAIGYMLPKLMKELAQAVKGSSGGLKMIVEKTPEGTKSPNTADATVQCFFPAPETTSSPLSGSYTG